MRSLLAERLRVRASSVSDSRSARGAPPHPRLGVIVVSHPSGLGNRRWRGLEMDDRRFDALTRNSVHATSRRGALWRLGPAGAGAAAAGIFGHRQMAIAHHCSYEGCGCATGTQHACGSGLVCCASSPGTPGGGASLPRARSAAEAAPTEAPHAPDTATGVTAAPAVVLAIAERTAPAISLPISGSPAPAARSIPVSTASSAARTCRVWPVAPVSASTAADPAPN